MLPRSQTSILKLRLSPRLDVNCAELRAGTWVAFVTMLAFMLGMPGDRVSGQEKAATPSVDKAAPAKESTKDEKGWIPLLKDLSSWTKTNFGGEGEVTLKEGTLNLGFGDPLTGVTYKEKDFPTDSYEIRWEAQRAQGQDFFAGVTFPIGDEFCSFIAGGWGGGLVGISSIDGNDASENETTGSEDFQNKRWYKFRIRVEPTKLTAWIDDREVVSVDRDGKRFSTRLEVDICKPLGYCVYQCEALVRQWEYRRLNAPAAKPEGTSQAVPKDSVDKSPPPLFIRIDKDAKGEPLALQTTVSNYRITTGPYAGASVDLIGAVHVGERSYYQELNRRFKQYEALLFELVADPDVRLAELKKDRGVYSPISAIQVGMKDSLGLAFQLDHIQYDAKNFVHADMTPEEFAADMKRRKDGFLATFARVLGSSLASQGTPETAGMDAKMVAALMSRNRPIALRRVMAEQFELMEDQLMGLADSNGQSTLVTERNRKALQVLEQQLQKGRRRLGIFYGAAHLEDMDQRLVRDFHAERGEVVWLDAWRLQ